MPDSKPFKLGKVWRRGITSALSFLAFGYCLGVFTSSQECISSILDWGDNSELLIAINSSLIPFGAVLGSVLAGFLSLYHGKRYNIIKTDILMMIGSILTYYPNTISFTIGRFVCGIAVGSFSMLSPGYVSEFTPKEVMVTVGSLGQFFIMTGITVAYVVCIPLPIGGCHKDIQYLVFLIFLPPGLIALVQFILLWKVFKRESPFWLLKQKKYDNAKSCLESIYNKEFAEHELQTHLEREKNNQASLLEENLQPTYKELLTCQKGTTKAMRLGTFLHIFQQLSGINALAFYSSLIFLSFGEGQLYARILTAIGSASRMIAMIFFIPVISRVNKKKVVVISSVLMGCCFLIISLTDQTGIKSLLIIFIFTYFAIFTNSIGPIAWIYSSMVMTDKGLAFAVAMNWTTAGFLVFCFPFMITGLGLIYTFLCLALLNILAAVYFAFDMVDSTGLSKQELRKILSSMR